MDLWRILFRTERSLDVCMHAPESNIAHRASLDLFWISSHQEQLNEFDKGFSPLTLPHMLHFRYMKHRLARMELTMMLQGRRSLSYNTVHQRPFSASYCNQSLIRFKFQIVKESFLSSWPWRVVETGRTALTSYLRHLRT